MPTDDRPSRGGEPAPGRLALAHRSPVVGLDLGDELGRRLARRIQEAQVLGRRRALLAPGDLALGERAQDPQVAADAHALLPHLAELGGAAAVAPTGVLAPRKPGRGARPGGFPAVQAASPVPHRRLAARASGARLRAAARREPEVARRVAVAQPAGAARPKTLDSIDRPHAHRGHRRDMDPLAAGFLVVRPHRSLPIGPSRVAKFTAKGNIFRRKRKERPWTSSFLSLAGETRHVEPPSNPAPTAGTPRIPAADAQPDGPPQRVSTPPPSMWRTEPVM
jgi:hypothetical protein